MMYRGRDGSNSLGTAGLRKMAFQKRSGLLRVRDTQPPLTVELTCGFPPSERGRWPNTAQRISRGKGPGTLTGATGRAVRAQGHLRTRPPSHRAHKRLAKRASSEAGAGQVASRLKSAHPTARSPRPPSRRRNPRT